MESAVTRAPWATAPVRQSVNPTNTATNLPGGFRAPTKQITSPPLLAAWKQSQAYAEIVAFILTLNESVKSKPNNQSNSQTDNPAIDLCVNFLTEAATWIDEIPPIKQSMRFGNKAFRSWHDRMMAQLPAFLNQLIALGIHHPNQPNDQPTSATDSQAINQAAATELSAYLDESFGNQQRIDYGTGHELNFVLFLCCCNMIGVFNHSSNHSNDNYLLVTKVFRCYLTLMEKLQLTYWLEPAGSKGSWGLDDYQFLCFLWGSSQLIDNDQSIEPSTILDQTKIARYEQDYLYLQAILFIHKMKTGPFHEHSAVLHSITSVPSWSKANSGLCRMYEEEVMNKFPIVQHIQFGSLLTMTRYIQGQTKIHAMSHAHQHKTTACMMRK